MMRFWYLLALAAIFMLPASAMTQGTSPPLGKLPSGVTPQHYNLDIEIIPEKDRFSGRVRILIELDESTNRLWMHGRELSVQSASLIVDGGTELSAIYREMGETGVAHLDFPQPVGPGIVMLDISYSAPFNGSLDGLYKVSREGEDYIYTHFQPLSARLAFPSFDEPRFKTPFQISLTVPNSMTAVSNGAERRVTRLENGLKRVEFETTAPMPTYLVAVAVGEFDVVEWAPIPTNTIRNAPIPLRGIAAKGLGKRLTHALENTAALLEILEEYFGTPYPFGKLDLVAAAGFKPSGMENVAAIFYAESVLLFDDNPSLHQSRYYAYIHAHELAHMWFGNLVTPAWWDDLWLNEAFATWLSGRVVETWNPAEFDNRSDIRRGNRAKWTDRLVSARQIRQPIESDHDIANAFDSITYRKGSSVLAMMERFMSPELFQQGIRRFIAKYRHRVATSEDFLSIMSETAQNPGVLRAFRSFLEQPGAPRLETEWNCAADGTTTVTLRQSRSLPLGSTGERSRLWALPVCLAYGNDQRSSSECLLMENASTTVRLSTSECPSWVLPNSGGAAYLNFDLPPEGWQTLVNRIDRLPAKEALAMLSSLHRAYESGSVDTETVLNAARKAALSPYYDVTQALMQVLRDIKNFVLPRHEREAFKILMQEMYKPALVRFDTTPAGLAKEETDSDLALLRSDLIWFMALDAEQPDLRKTLKSLSEKYLGFGEHDKPDPQAIHTDLLRIALNTAAAEGGIPFLKQLIALLRETEDPVLREHLLNAMAWVTDPVAAGWVRARLLEPDTSSFNASRIFRYQGQRADNAAANFAWLTANYDTFTNKIPQSDIAWMPWRVSALCDEDGRRKVEAFFKERSPNHRGGPRALANVLENMDICIALVSAQRPSALAAMNRQR